MAKTRELYTPGYVTDIAGPGDYVFIPRTLLYPNCVVGVNSHSVNTTGPDLWARQERRRRDADQLRKELLETDPSAVLPRPEARAFGINDRGTFNFGTPNFLLVRKGADDQRPVHSYYHKNITEDDEIIVDLQLHIDPKKFRTRPIAVLL